MPCSRTPKKTLRPAWSRVNWSSSGNSVFVDSLRSAAPPTIVGMVFSNAAMICWPAERVAILSLSHDVGSDAAKPGSGSPRHAASHSAARSSSASRHAR